jgi:hypothetical protein
MLNYKEPETRKQIAAILMTVAKKIEEDEEFAESIFSCLEKVFSVEKKNSKKIKKANKELVEREINIFEIYQNKGSDGLFSSLESFDLKGVIKIVVDNGLDPARKIRRWRSKEKIMKQVVEIVGKQMAKGEAFLK